MESVGGRAGVWSLELGEILGEGGKGIIVRLAVQSHLARDVAVKTLKVGPASAEALLVKAAIVWRN